MRPLGLVKQFHKLSITIEFDLFGFLNLKLLIFEVDTSIEICREFKLRKSTALDNVESYDRWGLHVSDIVRG